MPPLCWGAIRRLLLAAALALGCWLGANQAASAQEVRTGRSTQISQDQRRWARARARVLQLRQEFPRLGSNFTVLDPLIGKRYNCIAHSLGIHSRWVNPQTGPSKDPLAPMDRMYAEKGYTRVKGLNFRLDRRLVKVAVYAKMARGRIHQVTHAALQSRDGNWTSKLGQLPLIRHSTPGALSGPSYGVPVAVYVKRRA
jgi:hypothetical protein